MLIGSSNSLSYSKPLNFWYQFIHRIIRFQEEDCTMQYKYGGVRFFDFRLSVGKSGIINAKYGNVTYPIYNMYEILDFFNSCEDVIVRITLEKTFNEHIGIYRNSVDESFKKFCKTIEVMYDKICFCGGYRRIDGVGLYKFDSEISNGSPEVLDMNKISMWYKYATRLFPFMRKRLNNKYIDKFAGEKGYLLLNYVTEK